MWLKIVYGILGLIVVTILGLLIFFGATLRDFLMIEVIEAKPGVYFIMDYGGNSGLVIGDTSAVLIDTKMGRGSKKLLKITKDLAGDLPLTIINTHLHTDHTGGNALIPSRAIMAGNYGEAFWIGENKQKNLPTKWIQNDTTIYAGEKAVELLTIGANHTLADLFIYLPDTKILFTGDVYCHLSHPVIKAKSGADIDQWERTLNTYVEVDLPIEVVVPGHGDLANKGDLRLMAQYLNDIKQFPKSEIKGKYNRWTKLPFLATLNQSYQYIKEHYNP